jgi:hypothetical protein
LKQNQYVDNKPVCSKQDQFFFFLMENHFFFFKTKPVLFFSKQDQFSYEQNQFVKRKTCTNLLKRSTAHLHSTVPSFMSPLPSLAFPLLPGRAEPLSLYTLFPLRQLESLPLCNSWAGSSQTTLWQELCKASQNDLEVCSIKHSLRLYEQESKIWACHHLSSRQS